jgi:hypothetical protein
MTIKYYTAFCKTDDYGAQVGDPNPDSVRDQSYLHVLDLDLSDTLCDGYRCRASRSHSVECRQ